MNRCEEIAGRFVIAGCRWLHRQEEGAVAGNAASAQESVELYGDGTDG